MRKTRVALVLLVLLFLSVLQPIAVSALTSSEARQDWYEAKEQSREAQEAHRQAKVAWAAGKTDENNQRYIDTGKDALNAALDEVEAWLIWKECEVNENPEIPADLKATIEEDVEANLAKIGELRGDVSAVQNRFELGVTFLKMVGKYLELLTDVARNSGFVWVHVADTHADTIGEYELQLREAANDMPGNDAILEKLDMARSDLDTARRNIDNAEAEYRLVQAGGTPLVKFSNGNNYLKIARGNMLTAHGYLNQAYNLIVTGGGS